MVQYQICQELINVLCMIVVANNPTMYKYTSMMVTISRQDFNLPTAKALYMHDDKWWSEQIFLPTNRETLCAIFDWWAQKM